MIYHDKVSAGTHKNSNNPGSATFLALNGLSYSCDQMKLPPESGWHLSLEMTDGTVKVSDKISFLLYLRRLIC